MTKLTYPQSTPDAQAGSKSSTVTISAAHPTSRIRRIVASALPAAVITAGLFYMMDHLIGQEVVQTEPQIFAELTAITPQVTDPAKPRAREPLRPIAEATPPPSVPPMVAPEVDDFIPAISDFGKPPTEMKPVRMGPMSFTGVQIADRQVQPIRAPLLTYPRSAAERGIEGTCDVRFSVDVRGRPFDISADCTDSLFTRAAERAVARSEFAPRVENGQAIEQRGVLYPIEFSMSN